MKKKVWLCVTAGCLAAALAGCGTQTSETTAAQTEAGTAAETVTEATTTAETEAEKEVSGSIVLYTSQPEEDAQILVEGFNQIYPDVTVDVFRSGTEEVISKVLAEKQADAVQADVLLVADSVTFETLKEQDILTSYESPELEGIPETYIDPDHMYTGTKVITTGIMYNTELITEPLSSFADLTSEAVKDNCIMPSPLYSGAAAYNVGVISRTEGLGWEFWQALKENGATVDKGNGAVQTAVVAGEQACGIIVDYMANRSKNDGAPVEFVYPEEGSPVITEPIGLVKTSQNPDAAKAFIDFVLSEEGQELAVEIGYTPVKEGIDAPEGLKKIGEFTNMEADIQELYQNKEQDKAQFTEIFQ